MQQRNITGDAGHLLYICQISRCRRPWPTTRGLCHADSGKRNHINTQAQAWKLQHGLQLSMNTSTHLHKQKHDPLKSMTSTHTKHLTSRCQTFNTCQKTDTADTCTVERESCEGVTARFCYGLIHSQPDRLRSRPSAGNHVNKIHDFCKQLYTGKLF